jgi:hypothetical protein
VTKTGIALLALALLVQPALAYHRQTPPIVAVTTTGDTPVPRVPAGGRRLALAFNSSGRQIFRQDRGHNLLEQITTSGDSTNPTISAGADTIAWDSDCTQFPGCQGTGRQIFMWVRGTPFQVSQDPTGTSSNAALSGKGTSLAFESNGDLAGANPTGARQIFVRGKNGVVTQASQGKGTSGNPCFDRSGHRLVFDSTDDLSGNDTHIAQIWLLSPVGISPQILTNGLGSSRRPALSSDGHWIAFESTADLTGDGHDTHVSQIFVYDMVKRIFAQVTSDATGCSGASVSAVPADMSVGYVCHGQGFFYHLLTHHHFALPINGGDTAEAVAELGGHFMVVSTTANMLGSGTTPGHLVYMLNLFKLVATPLD